jgi:hypothetical protein
LQVPHICPPDEKLEAAGHIGGQMWESWDLAIDVTLRQSFTIRDDSFFVA